MSSGAPSASGPISASGSTSDAHLSAYLEAADPEARGPGPGAFRKLTSLLRETPGAPRLLAGGISLVVLGAFVTLLEPRLLGYAIDDAILPHDLAMLRKIAIAYLAVTVVRVIALIGQGYLFEKLGQRITQALRVRLFSHLMRLPVATFDQNPAGRLVTRVTNDIAALSEMFSAGFVSLAFQAIMVVGILAWLMILDLKLGLIAASVFPALVGVSILFTRWLRGAYRDSRSKLSALNAFFAETLSGMRVVQLFNRQRIQLERYARINEWYTDALVSTVRVYAYFQPSITLAAGASTALVLYWGVSWAEPHGHLPLGVLAAFFSYVGALFQPVREIAEKWNTFLSGMISAQRIFSLFDWESEPRESSHPVTRFRGRIEFRNVWFAYDAERWVLKDFSLQLEPGSRVGIVGHTGAGKSTLISLLMRFYDPQRGQILIDDRDIREYSRGELRAAIGLIQQDAFLFSGTVADNLVFWRGQHDPSALRARDAMDRMGLRPGLAHQRIAERGANLSMGERQVIAFARAVASSPSLWVLDEATSNLDSVTEAHLQKELAEVSRGQTQLLIAHRLATVREADQIIVLHHGAIVEQGTHDALLAREGLYARLYRFQSEGNL